VAAALDVADRHVDTAVEVGVVGEEAGVGERELVGEGLDEPVDTRRASMSEGDFSRPWATSRAAAPDTSGDENDVPLSNL
jgi:hypothetical protein